MSWCDKCNNRIKGINKCKQCIFPKDPNVMPSNFMEKGEDIMSEKLQPLNHIKDSGERTEYHTGAVRDLKEKKGRCDLMPLSVVSHFLAGDIILKSIHTYIYVGNTDNLYAVLSMYLDMRKKEDPKYDKYTMMLDVAMHYEEGLQKYPERNWELGITLSSYIDSATRHYLKWQRGDTDEPHARAFVWNIMNCIWTHHNFKDDFDILDLPFAH